MFQMKITKTTNFKTLKLYPLGFGEELVDSTRFQIKITKKIQTVSNTTTVILVSQNKLDFNKTIRTTPVSSGVETVACFIVCCLTHITADYSHGTLLRTLSSFVINNCTCELEQTWFHSN